MNLKQTKKILVSSELSSSAIGAFFEELGFELNYKFILGHEYLFAIDNACPDVIHIPRLKIKNEIDSKLQSQVRSSISEDYFSSTQGRKLLTSYFNDGVEFDLVDRYSKDFKNIYTVKIHEYLNVGFFTDQIIVEAYKAKFDIKSLRDYLNVAMNFAFKKVEVAVNSMPIDVSYSHNGDAFTIQISMEVDGFKGIHELDNCLQDLSENVNFFDVTYFHKKKRLTLSSLIFKDKNLAMRSHFFTEIAAKSAIESEVEEQSDLISGLETQESVNYEAQKTVDEQSKKLAIARRFSLFIKNYRKTETPLRKLEKLVILDIDDYLGFYPKQEAVKILDNEIKSFILKLIQDDQLNEGITDYVQKVANENLDNQVKDIQSALSEKSLNDVEEILIIHGTSQDSNDVFRVKNWVEDGSDDKWEVKKSQINEKIQDEFQRISSQGKNIVQDDIVRVVSKELNAEEGDIKVVVKGIVEEVVSRELVKKQKLEEAFALKILAGQSAEQVREKLEAQITRMKKIMDGLKREVIKLQTEKVARDSSDKAQAIINSDESEANKLRSALTRTLDALKGKERLIEKMKGDFELLNKSKDLKIESLNSRIEELKKDFVSSKEFANEEKLQQLETENKSLLARLEHSNKKVNIINENIENRESIEIEKREREIELLKSNMQKAQSVIERFKQDKLEMELRFNDEKEAHRKLKEEKNGSGSSAGATKEEILEKDAIISVLTSERKVAEEKIRAQGMELKKIEQKLKFTTSQLESAEKRKATPPAGQKSPEALQKLLDHSNARLAETANEVAEKRKEAIKLKQENTMMINKIAELEKKLGNVEKKAS